LKAKNCFEGRHELVVFAKEHGIEFDICGKVIVATDEKELPNLDRIFENGVQNNIEGIKKISSAEVKEIEPFVECIAGIYVPVTGIIDFRGATAKMVELALAINPESQVRLSTEFLDVVKKDDFSVINTSKGEIESHFLVYCSGLHADRLAKKDGVKLKEQVVPFRGDYYELADHAKHKVKNLIYPVPDPNFPFLGVHFTRMVDGNVECGPNAVFSFKREGYNKTDFSFRDTWEALTYQGTWKLFLSNIKYGIDEYRRAFSKRLFLKSLQRMIPSLTMDDIKPARAGVRAQLLSQNGDTRDDFRIEHHENSIHVLNAPSPAATASLSIGNYITEVVAEKFEL
jgi:L-2-hydroxyglutarate oxidase